MAGDRDESAGAIRLVAPPHSVGTLAQPAVQPIRRGGEARDHQADEVKRSVSGSAGERGPATIRAIGPDGWVVAERTVDRATAMVVEDAAEQLRATVRGDTGWTPRIVVLDRRGRDVTARYDVN